MFSFGLTLLSYSCLLQLGEVSTPTTPVYTAPPLFARYANYNPPPVPQLPEPYRFAGLSTTVSPGSDVFHNTPNSPDFSKPLPVQPKSSHPSSEEEIEQVLATASLTSSPAPGQTIKPRLRDGHTRGHSRGNGSASSARRRSASVGDIERTKLTIGGSDPLPPPSELPRSAEPGKTSTEWDTSGIISMFKGELSQLDPISATSLEITDPSTPSRLQSRARGNTDPSPPSHSEGSGTIRRRPSGVPSLTSPPVISTLTERASTDSSPTKRSPVSPKRSSMNHSDSPVRSTTRRTVSRPTPPVAASAMYASPRTVSTPLLGVPSSSTPPGKNWNSTSPVFSNPFTPQPSVFVNGASSVSLREPSQARSPASNSEPVLVPGSESELGPRRSSQPHTHAKTPDFHRTVRLVPSTTSFSYPNGQASGSASQVDITDAASASSTMSPARGVSLEGDDMEARGQELAKRCWTDDETFLPREKVAEWLGGA
jgi:PH and SEC7 domain-containing protein